jgi:voltage-gated potassium channel
VAVTTTGYGDIVPVSQGARLVTVVVVTPIRVAFLILVVSTTVEVLAATTRYLLRVQRWRRVMRDHYVICGYGTKGRAAAATLVSKGVEPEKVVVVEWDATTAGEATADGFTAVVGDCTRESVLSRANVASAKGVVVAVNSDSTAVLTTLTIRILNPAARLVAAVKEAENSKILRKGGASLVVTSDEATGRLLGLAIDNPHQAALIEDLLLIGEGVDLVETDVTDDLVGGRAPDRTVAVIRGGRIVTSDVVLQPGDRLLELEENEEPPPAV